MGGIYLDNLRDNFFEEKEFLTKYFKFPSDKEKISLDGIGKETKSKYLVDINRKSYRYIKKITLQNRIPKNTILLRLDFNGSDHTNPDGELISGFHIHVYQEGYDTSWAYPLNHEFLNTINPNFDLNEFQTDDRTKLFEAFIKFCNFVNHPIYEIPMI